MEIISHSIPIKVCYSMTINKSQGQTLSAVGVYLKRPVFTHGQLYVAISRVTTKQGLKILIEDEQGMCTDETRNVVYREVLAFLPHQWCCGLIDCPFCLLPNSRSLCIVSKDRFCYQACAPMIADANPCVSSSDYPTQKRKGCSGYICTCNIFLMQRSWPLVLLIKKIFAVPQKCLTLVLHLQYLWFLICYFTLQTTHCIQCLRHAPAHILRFLCQQTLLLNCFGSAGTQPCYSMQRSLFLGKLQKGREKNAITVRVVRKWAVKDSGGQGAPLFVGLVIADAKVRCIVDSTHHCIKIFVFTKLSYASPNTCLC